MLSWVDGLVRPIVTMREVRTHVTRVFVPCHKDAALFATATLHHLAIVWKVFVCMLSRVNLCFMVDNNLSYLIS